MKVEKPMRCACAQLKERVQVSCMLGNRGEASVGSAAEGMQIHLDLLSAAQHPHGGIEASWRDRHLPSTHQLPIPGEKHLRDQKGATASYNTQHFHCNSTD